MTIINRNYTIGSFRKRQKINLTIYFTRITDCVPDTWQSNLDHNSHLGQDWTEYDNELTVNRRKNMEGERTENRNVETV